MHGRATLPVAMTDRFLVRFWGFAPNDKSSLDRKPEAFLKSNGEQILVTILGSGTWNIAFVCLCLGSFTFTPLAVQLAMKRNITNVDPSP